jgi:hypothetical protein
MRALTLRLRPVAALLFLVTAAACATGPGRGVPPAGYSEAQVERDYFHCEQQARLAYQDHFYSRSSPLPFGPGPQSPSDHARALHGLSGMTAMRDTCLAAKGYRVE